MNLPNTPSTQPRARSRSTATRTTRRTLLLGLAASALAGVAALGPGCSKSDTGSTTQPTATTAGEPVTVGFLYVGSKDDYGYNQAHADGAAAVKKMPGVTVLENEKIPETKDVESAMETMIKQGDATLIFPTSFGYYDPHVREVAKKYPNVTFLWAGTPLAKGEPSNCGSYFAYIDELEYLCGMAAGAATKTNKLGYVAAKGITPVLRDINAFELGAKSMNPNATTTVIFTGDWFLPTEEANAVTNLANQQVDVITGHVDSPKVLIQTAEKLGLFSCGYHYDGSALAPKGYLTGAEFNWGPMYVDYVTKFKAGTLKPGSLPNGEMGDLKKGSVKLSPYGKGVSADTQAKIDAVKKQMTDGTFNMYAGPLKDNTGKEVIPAGKSYGDEDGWLWSINFFVDGVIGKTGS